jgi:WD40 repeat protein
MIYFVGVRLDGVDIWDYETKQLLTTLNMPYGQTRGNVRAVSSSLFCCSNDGGVLAVSTSSEGVIVWNTSDISDCKIICDITVHDTPQYTGSLSAVCFTENHGHLVAAVGMTFKVFDTASGAFVRGVEAHNDRIIVLVAINDEMISVSVDGTIKVWDACFVESRQHRLDRDIKSACVSPSGDVIAVVQDEKKLLILDVATFQLRNSFEGHVDIVILGEITSDGCLLARQSIGLSAQMYRVYDIVTGTLVAAMLSSCDVCRSLDCKYYYGSDLSGNIVCYDFETRSQVECPFTRLAASTKYTGLYIISTLSVLM